MASQPKPLSHFSPGTTLCQICQSSKTVQTEASALVSPLKKLGCYVHKPERGWELVVASWSYSAMLGPESLLRRCPESPYWLQGVCFHVCSRCRSLSVSFWIIHREVGICCSVSVFVGGRGPRGPCCSTAVTHLVIQSRKLECDSKAHPLSSTPQLPLFLKLPWLFWYKTYH